MGAGKFLIFFDDLRNPRKIDEDNGDTEFVKEYSAAVRILQVEGEVSILSYYLVAGTRLSLGEFSTCNIPRAIYF